MLSKIPPLLLACLALLLGVPARAAEPIDAAAQTVLIHQRCAVCHTDAHRNGGMSLEHFDAAEVDPGTAAMLLSKITKGMPLATLRAAQTDASLEGLILARTKSGALGASGRPMPDAASQIALVAALTRQASGAEQWSVSRPGNSTLMTADMVVEAPTADKDTVTIYRLAITCDTASRQGEVLLAWANGTPDIGREFAVVKDNNAPATRTLEPGEKDFPGAMGTSGTGGVFLVRPGETGFALPARSLMVRDIFPADRISFAFDGLERGARSGLSRCFAQG